MPPIAIYLITTIFIFLLSSFAKADANNIESQKTRTALVLGGGGARGSAHIGILEILERERVPIDCVVGTSMGALVAGAYVSGLTPAQMREKLSAENWTDMFLDNGDYSKMSYRQVQVTKRYLSGTQMGITKNGLQLQPGVIAGEKIKLFFNHLVGADLGEKNIENLPISMAIVATDIGTGERVVFKSGSLTKAMRASMSVPGLMAPVEQDGRKLVDGGLVDNLPIDIARELCHADRVIAVNVGSKLKPAEEVNSLLNVTEQMIGILTNQNVNRSLRHLQPQDIYIHPDLKDFTATDFAHHKELADLGREAAENQIAKIKTLSVNTEDYAQWEEKRQDLRNSNINVDQIKIAPLQFVHPEFIARQIHQKENTKLNRAQLEEDLIRTYADGYYKSVDYKISKNEEGNTLEIIADEKKWSKDHIVFGYALDAEYRQGSNFNLLAAYRNTWLNTRGGEFFATADIGSQSMLKVEFYQPLNYRQQYFIQPNYSKSSETLSVFSDENKITEYKILTSYSELLLGINNGAYGQTTLGWRNYHKIGSPDNGFEILPTFDEHYGGLMLKMAIDKRNRLYFPSNGWYGDLSFFDADNEGYQKVTSEIGFAYPMDSFVLAGRSSYITSLKNNLPFYDAGTLGGFLNLSAYASHQILGENIFYSHLRGEQIIGKMPLGLSGDMRIGLGIEAAHVGANFISSENEKWLNSAVIYLGGETPAGPLYIGWGFNLSGNYNLYFRLGSF